MELVNNKLQPADKKKTFEEKNKKCDKPQKYILFVNNFY